MYISSLTACAATSIALAASASLPLLQERQSSAATTTFYGGNVAGGSCSFSTYTLPAGIYGTALSAASWDNSGNCGVCISVSYNGGAPITAMIVDQCPECPQNALDLFQDAFTKIANPSLGRISTSWSYIDCPIKSSLQIHMKEGVSKFWFSAQVVNGNQRTAKLEVSTDGGQTYKLSGSRQTYNFFQISSGTGSDTATIRVTSASGNVVVIPDVPIKSGAVVTGPANYV